MEKLIENFLKNKRITLYRRFNASILKIDNSIINFFRENKCGNFNNDTVIWTDALLIV
jgi:hypothetical protein